jgi:hypothetical protein
MGLDVTVFLGRVHHEQRSNDRAWFQVSGMVELMHEGRALVEALDGTNGPTVFFYAPAGDGETEVFEDMYGEQLEAVTIGELAVHVADPGDDRINMLRALVNGSPPWVTHAVVFCH